MSLNLISPEVNAPERVEVTNKTTQLPITNKRGRNLVTAEKASLKPPRKQIKSKSMTVNANQPQVDGHQIDVHHQESNINVHTNYNVGISKQSASVSMGNHTEPEEISEISINYIDSEET